MKRVILFLLVGILGARAQVSHEERANARLEFCKNLDRMEEIMRKYEPLRLKGMENFTKLYDEKKQNILGPRIDTHPIWYEFVSKEGKDIQKYMKNGDHYTSCYQTGKLMMYVSILAGDYLTLSGAEKDFISKKIETVASKEELMIIYNQIHSQLSKLEYAFQQYHGQLHWNKQE